MVLAISIDKTKHRGDSDDWPIVTATDYGTYGRIKLGDWEYYPATSAFDLVLPNRTEPFLGVRLRKVAAPVFILGTNITQSTTTFNRTSGSGWNGAYYNTVLSSVKCSIEAKPVDFNLQGGISLQNGDVTVVHDYNNAAVKHSLVFDIITNGPAGKGFFTIREEGQIIPNRNEGFFVIGDKAMIELENGIVRYWLIKANGTLVLLRATKSKLTAAPKAQVLLYDPGSPILQDVVIHNNEEVLQTIESVGVLENFQDWVNEFFHASTAQAITMADGESQFTYPSFKRVIRNLGASLNMRTKPQRDAFLAFFNYHGQEKDFIFVDNAHKDENNDSTEFFARFTSPFGDKARGSCLSIHQAQITETLRREIIVKLTRPPPAGLHAYALVLNGRPILIDSRQQILTP